MTPERPSNVTALIEKLKLQPHPEGGFFAETYRATDTVKPNAEHFDGAEKASATSIYFLLETHNFSAFHRIKSDEQWHFYEGSPVEIRIIDRQTGELTTHVLGNPVTTPGASFQVVVPARSWFAASIQGDQPYSLVGCTVSPGFEFQDFELADRAALQREHPQHQTIIEQYTRIAADAAPSAAKEKEEERTASVFRM